MEDKKNDTRCTSMDIFMKHFMELSEIASKTKKPEQKIKIIECMLKIVNGAKDSYYVPNAS